MAAPTVTEGQAFHAADENCEVEKATVSG